jgi:exopolyphosphatase/pppGpp-phosphohydrolase
MRKEVAALQRKNYDKVRYIRRYADLRKKERELQQELKTIQEEYDSLQAVTCDNAPVSSGTIRDLSDFIMRKDAQVSKAIRDLNIVIDLYQEIAGAVQRVEDLQEREVLRLKHMKRWGWERVAESMGYSVRQAQRLHGRALEHFRIPERKDANT